MSCANIWVILVCHITALIIGVLVAVFDQKLCLNDTCKTASEMIKVYMNLNADPCEDFYKFTCGNHMTDDETQDEINIIYEAELQQVIKIFKLLNEPPNQNEPKVFYLSKQFYRNCKNSFSIHEKLDNIAKLMWDIGGFPSLEGKKFKENAWTFLKAIKRLRQNGLDFSSFFTIDTHINPHSPENVILSLQIPYALQFSLVMCDYVCKYRYQKRYSNSVSILGGDRDAQFDALDVMKLERNLALNALKYLSKPDLFDLFKATKTLAHLSASYNFTNWRDYINIILRMEANLPDNTLILVLNEDYMKSLTIIISNTPKHVMANYMMWYLLRPLMDNLGQDLDEVFCFRKTVLSMPVAVQAMYVNRYGMDSYKEVVFEIFSKINQQLKNDLLKSNWIDNNTLLEAYSKVENIILKSGYPKLLLNESFLNEYYANIEASDSFEKDIIRHHFDMKFRKIFKTFQREEWTIDTLTTPVFNANAFYYVFSNTIEILDGLLQSPMFNANLPEYFNYGMIGCIIGHELSHCLDNTCIHFDKEGKARHKWGREAWEEYKIKLKCFIDQFTNVKLLNGSVNENNGTKQLGENIADSSGLNLAFKAYRTLSKSKPWPDLLLPNIPYSQEQLFFISFALMFCYTTQYISDDKYAPDYLRVWGSVQNNYHFSEVFNCDKNTNMNPIKKCELW